MLKHWRSIIFIIAALAISAVIALGETIPSPYREIAVGVTAFVGLLGVLPFLSGSDGAKQADNRRTKLIEIVRKVWIEGDNKRLGVLEDMLRDAQFDIDLATVPHKAGRALSGMRAGHIETKIVIQRRDGQPPLPIDNTPDALAKAFYDNDKQLLILGASGSGKSVLLLQLAQRLLEDAEQDKLKAVPVVINLSTWAIKREPISDWIVEELGRGVYGVSRKLAQEWIKGHRFIYLLDGLDEVAEAHRAECLTALNAFITPERQVVVCSRSAEYAELEKVLNVRNAVEVQPFAADQFEGYLRQYIPHTPTVNALMNVLKHDAEVWMEVQKPLFANILINTYRDGRTFSGDTGDGDVINQLRQLVIEPYVVRQLQNVPETKHSYLNDKTRHYLSWLGWQMRQSELTTFYRIVHASKWVKSAIWKQAMRFLGFVATPFSGFLIAFIVILGAISFTDSQIIEKPSEFSTSVFQSNLLEYLLQNREFRVTFMLTIVVLLAGSALTFKALELYAFEILKSDPKFTNTYINYISDARTRILPMLFGLLGMVATIIVFSFIFSILISLITGFMGLAITILIYQVYYQLPAIALYSEGSAPLRFDHLLYHARDRRLMRQVGGGFIFLHRYVLEYFAAEWEKGRQRDAASAEADG